MKKNSKGFMMELARDPKMILPQCAQQAALFQGSCRNGPKDGETQRERETPTAFLKTGPWFN